MGNSRKLLDKPTWCAANMSVPGTDRSGTDGFWCTAALTFVQKGLQDRGQSQPHTLITEGKQTDPSSRLSQVREAGKQVNKGYKKGKVAQRASTAEEAWPPVPLPPSAHLCWQQSITLKSKSNQSSLYPSSLLPSLCAQNCQTSFLQPAR